MKKPILVKLGGSILTNKGSKGAPVFRVDVARRLAKELRGVKPLVIVVGAGSWGHPLALKYRIGKERLSGKRLVEAVSRTQASVATLRSAVAQVFRKAGLPVVEIPASSVAYGHRDALAFDAALFAFYLARGLVPVTGGDAILDGRLGARILSGDEILRALSASLGATRVVFATDVDGVVEDARVVPSIRAREIMRVRTTVSGDATGGMAGKLWEAASIASSGVPVIIVNGQRGGRVRSAALGKRTTGTRVAR